jgi:SsrA-binding protein
MSKKKVDSEICSNRRAFHDYEILETFEAGIVLLGTEVKSLRDHGGSLQDAYILVAQNGDVILKNSSIAPYRFGGIAYNHAERRDRKLLLHKREAAKLRNFSQEKGFTLIPLSIYLKKGFMKVKVASARGKKTYDKRAAQKEKEHDRDISRAMREKE